MAWAMQDCETGEPNCCSEGFQNAKIKFDEETGEPDNEKLKMYFHKTKFNIPKQYLQNTRPPTKKKWFLKNCKETYTLADKEKVIHLKEEIILGYNKTSHRMFLIPSLFFFTKLTAAILGISEILLHIWAHRKNSKNTNPNVYYRSPLHILTSQFCAICRSETEWDNINKLQDSRRLHVKLKQMTKTLS